VCALIAAHLPSEAEAIHAIYSGTIVGVLLDPQLNAPLQNATTRHLPGDLIWMHYDAFSRFGHPEPLSEIYWAYDRHARSVTPGQFAETPASVFALAETHTPAWRAFAERSAQVRWSGRSQIRTRLTTERAPALPDARAMGQRPLVGDTCPQS
jgi:hypothetical protein